MQFAFSGPVRFNSDGVVAQLHQVLQPFVLRRLKVDVAKGLPPKKQSILKVRAETSCGTILTGEIDAPDGRQHQPENGVEKIRKVFETF